MPKAWTPVGQWITAIPNNSWYRIDAPGRATVCAVVWPKERPAWDGGEWTNSELWTATVPLEDGDLRGAPPRGIIWAPGWIYAMYDKPHRLSWALDNSDCEVLSREPLPDALTAALEYDSYVEAATAGPVHRDKRRQCSPRCYDWCQRKHRWRGYCSCGWTVIRGRLSSANRDLDVHVERVHGGDDV